MMVQNPYIKNAQLAPIGNPLAHSLQRRLAAFILVLTACGVIGAIVIAQQGEMMPSPFAAYIDILPGHQRQMAELRGFGCQQQTNNYSYYSSDYATCTFIPASGTFSEIEVLVEKDVIVQSKFWIRDNGLHVGDLMLTMEMGKLRTYSNDLLFFWHTFFITVKTAAKKNATALRPVANVTFTDPGFQWQTSTFTGVY